jgi:transglutaminase-like putative cysteine protease
LYIAAAAWVLFAEERARAKRWRSSEVKLGWRPGPAVRVAAMGVLIVVAMTPFLPGYGAPPLLRTSGPGGRVAFNPFIAIRATLQKRPEVPLFALTTNRPTYLRLTTLEHFDGDVWRQGNVRNSVPIGPTAILPYEPSVPSELVQQHYRIQDLAGPWLPAAYDPTSVTNVSGVKIETETRSLVLQEVGGLPSGARYDVTSEVPEPTVADLDKAFSYDEQAMSDYLSVGGSVPSVVRQIAQRVAGSMPTPYRKALALQNYLRTFTYDENVAQHHSFKDIVQFLTQTKRGYCEQFAGSMALMARTIGLPSRVAIGFGYGTKVGDEYQITTREAHAWVEIFFPGSGWVTFEPTPRAGVAQVPPYAVGSDAANPSATPGVTPSATASTNPSPSNSTREPLQGRAGITPGTSGRPAWVFATVITGVAVAFIALVIALPLMISLIRRRRARGERGKGVFEYLEFLAWCNGAGLGRRPGETPLEHAGRLSAADTAAVRPLNRLAELADDALWGPEKDLDPVEMARLSGEARSVLRLTVSRRARWLAAAGWGRWRLAS